MDIYRKCTFSIVYFYSLFRYRKNIGYAKKLLFFFSRKVQFDQRRLCDDSCYKIVSEENEWEISRHFTWPKNSFGLFRVGVVRRPVSDVQPVVAVFQPHPPTFPNAWTFCAFLENTKTTSSAYCFPIFIALLTCNFHHNHSPPNGPTPSNQAEQHSKKLAESND